MEEIPEIKFEAHPNTPIKDLVSEEKLNEIREFFDDENQS